MDLIKKNFGISLNYIKTLLKWLAVSVIVGLAGGLVGSLFHISVDFVTELRTEHSWLLFFLPVGGLAIAAMYHLFRSKAPVDTNRVLDGVKGEKDVPLIMVPLIFISTVITHLLGGSAGREGAALQLGGGLAYNIGRLLRLKANDMRVVVMAGMSSVFSALFGTPLTAAVFSLEVVAVGSMNYAGLLPCIVAAITSFGVSQMFGISPVRFSGVAFDAVSVVAVGKVFVLSALCALVGILFCTAIHKCEHFADKLVPNKFLRTVIGAVIIVVLALVLQTRDYNGAGMDVITRAIAGEARAEAFILKIIFTAITISAGFKGGEIVPAFFVGSTLGCVAGSLLGINPGFGAAIGFVALFCSAVNCPLASLLLSVEVFGTEGMLFFAIACAVSYMMSGSCSLYKSQSIIHSKINAEHI